MVKSSSETDQLIALLEAGDTAAIDALLSGIQQQITTLENKADGLRQIKKAIEIAKHGKPPRVRKAKPSGIPKAADAPGGRKPDAWRIRAYLEKVGAAKPATIAADLNLPADRVEKLTREGDFEITPTGHVRPR